MAYHINPETGRANKCTAQPGACRFGLHDATKEGARRAYEETMASKATPKPAQKPRMETPRDRAMAHWLRHLKDKIERERDTAKRETLKGDYSRATAFAQRTTPSLSVPSEEALDEYIDYVQARVKKLTSGPLAARSGAQAEYARLIALGRRLKLTSR